MHHVLRLVAVALRMLFALAAEAVSPAACAACDARIGRSAAFCPPCAATIVRVRPGSPCAFAAYGGALATAIRRFKFSDRPDLARPLGDLARRAAHDAGIDADVIVPVPLHARRLALRGYNQAALLARALAGDLDAALVTSSLVRVRDTGQQAALGKEERGRNVEEAFAVRHAGAIRGRRVLLVDDVATTGATLAACAAALERGGAARVVTLVLARAELRSDASLP